MKNKKESIKMKLDLKALKYLYNHLKNNDELNEEITDWSDFVGYIIGLIIDNVEYDYGIDFYDYVDKNDFIKESE
jgi:hypothetical protein